MQKIRVKIKGYDHRVVDKATEQIVRTVIDTGAKVVGPVPLPNQKWVVAVHKGPHIDAKAKEHYGMITHNRLVDILEPNANTIDALTHIQLPAGVDIQLKQ